MAIWWLTLASRCFRVLSPRFDPTMRGWLRNSITFDAPTNRRSSTSLDDQIRDRRAEQLYSTTPTRLLHRSRPDGRGISVAATVIMHMFARVRKKRGIPNGGSENAGSTWLEGGQCDNQHPRTVRVKTPIRGNNAEEGDAQHMQPTAYQPRQRGNRVSGPCVHGMWRLADIGRGVRRHYMQHAVHAGAIVQEQRRSGRWGPSQTRERAM